jgi:hypothetical protein
VDAQVGNPGWVAMGDGRVYLPIDRPIDLLVKVIRPGRAAAYHCAAFWTTHLLRRSRRHVCDQLKFDSKAVVPSLADAMDVPAERKPDGQGRSR